MIKQNVSFFRFSARRVYKPETSGMIEPVPASANLSTSGRIVPQVFTLFLIFKFEAFISYFVNPHQD
jgi:hypothetical protein